MQRLLASNLGRLHPSNTVVPSENEELLRAVKTVDLNTAAELLSRGVSPNFTKREIPEWWGTEDGAYTP
jgi:hypothetical protein